MKKLILITVVSFNSIVCIDAIESMKRILQPDDHTRPRVTGQAPVILENISTVQK